MRMDADTVNAYARAHGLSYLEAAEALHKMDSRDRETLGPHHPDPEIRMNKWQLRRRRARWKKAREVLKNLGIDIKNRLMPPGSKKYWPKNNVEERRVNREVEAALKEIGIREPGEWIDLESKPETGEGFFWRTVQNRNTTGTEGLPDYLVGFAGHPIIIGLELKKRTTRGPSGSMQVLPEQEMPIAQRTVFLVRSGEQAKWAVRYVRDRYIKPLEAKQGE